MWLRGSTKLGCCDCLLLQRWRDVLERYMSNRGPCVPAWRCWGGWRCGGALQPCFLRFGTLLCRGLVLGPLEHCAGTENKAALAQFQTKVVLQGVAADVAGVLPGHGSGANSPSLFPARRAAHKYIQYNRLKVGEKPRKNPQKDKTVQ